MSSTPILMDAFFVSGRFIDVILAVVALEVVALVVLARRGAAVPSMARPHRAVLWPVLLSGALLMLAVRVSVADAPWYIVGVLLALAGCVHAVDLAYRIALLKH